MEVIAMKVTLRTEPLRVVRAAHQVPGVMYGRSIDSISIQADINDVLSALKTYGRSETFKIRLDDKYHHVYFKAVQSNVLKPNEITHFDLHRVTEKELVTGLIPIEMVGHEVFYNQHMFAELVKHEILATYSPVIGHAKLVVDVSKMDLHDEKKLSDLNLEGLEIKEDLNQTIVIIKEVRAHEEETEEKALVITEEISEETLSKK
jgi:large subunit ribosomal protein L25